MRLLSSFTVVAFALIGAAQAQITEQPDSGADREARPRRRDQGRRAPARYAQSASRRSGRDAGRLGARQLRARSSRTAAASPTTRAGSCTCSMATTSRGVRERRRGLSVRDLQPARERIHRLRVSSGVREERTVLHGAQRERAGQSDRRRTSSRRASRRNDVDLPQRHHRVARDEPGGEHVRGHAARAAARRAVVTNLTHPMGAVEFNPTAKPGLARLRPALHQRQRSRVQQRRRTEREQPGPDAAARLDHHRRSCASIRAVRR